MFRGERDMALAHDYHALMIHFHDEKSVMALLDYMDELETAFPSKEIIRYCTRLYKALYPEDKRAAIKLFMEESYCNGHHNPIRHMLLHMDDPILLDTVLQELKIRGNYLDNIQKLVHSSHNHWDVETENHLAYILVEGLTADEKNDIMMNNVTRFPTLIRVINDLRDHHYMND